MSLDESHALLDDGPRRRRRAIERRELSGDVVRAARVPGQEPAQLVGVEAGRVSRDRDPRRHLRELVAQRVAPRPRLGVASLGVGDVSFGLAERALGRRERSGQLGVRGRDAA